MKHDYTLSIWLNAVAAIICMIGAIKNIFVHSVHSSTIAPFALVLGSAFAWNAWFTYRKTV